MLANKCISIDLQPINLPSPSGEDPFRLLANCFLLFCYDLAVFIFPMLLPDIQTPK